MELFKDKGVLELTKELTKELRTRSIEDKEIPRFIFVCGEQILDDKGNLIDTNILESQNNIRYSVSYTHLQILFNALRGIPRPESLTDRKTFSLLPVTSTVTVDSFSLNLMALSIKL